MADVVRVLQVEDSEPDAALLVCLLEDDGHIIHSEQVETADEMRRALARQEWDLVLSDYRLPQFNAADALRVLQETGCDVPFLVVCGDISEECAAGLMRAGARDYILKTHLTRLAPAVRRELGEAQSRRERRQAEERLRDRDEWLALAFSVNQIGMFDYHPQSGKLTWTEGTRRHFGVSQGAEVTHDTFLRGLHPDDRERVTELLNKPFDRRSGGEYAVEYRTIGLSDHAERWLVERGRVFFDAAERPSRFVGFTIDITDWKRLEEQFRHAQKMDSIGRLAGGIAHDFNNLLTVISGYGQMTLDELPTHHPLRGGVQEVLKAAAQATSLTRQLLTFSRRHAARTETIDLNELVADIQKMLGRLIGEDVKLTISMDPAAGAFRGDRTHIEQVIMNLVVNAKDAMPRGGTLSIETGPIEVDTRFAEAHVDVAAGRYTALTVTDTGTGMSPEVKSQIFEPFFTTKEHGKGTGLGLSMVYGIVKQCGATISVESEPGQGTAFRVLFPTVEFEPQDAQPDSPVAAAPGSETILLAEDEPGVRSYVRATLEQNGYRVLDCGNGREAVERARQHAGPIHLLVTDGVMPEMGGMELAKEFSACRPGIPVLCMSGYSDQVWSFAAAPTSYIQKPFTPTAILSQIRTLLDQQSGGV